MDSLITSLPEMAEKAKHLFAEGEYEQAAVLFEKIAEGYSTVNDDINAAESKNNASVAYLKADDARKSLDIVQGTETVFAQAGDVKRQAMALGNQAAALEGLGKLDQALEIYRQASDLLKQANETELRSYVLKSISALELRKGKYMESMASMQTAIDNKKSPSWVDRFLRKLLGLIFKR